MSVAKNTVVNMAEDLTMLVGYSTVNKFIHDWLASEFPPEVEENGREKMNIALEVLSGGVSFLFMSTMMEVIRREERFIEYLFAAGEAVITVLYARNKGYFDSMAEKLRNAKGYKASVLSKILASEKDNQNTFISQVYQQIQVILNGRSASHDVANTISASNSSMDTAINRERINLEFAKANNDSFNNSVLLKTMTGTFTEADEIILKKIIGRSNFSSVPLSIDELNQVREFMIVKDSNGRFIGLTEAFTDLVNGLGFLKR